MASPSDQAGGPTRVGAPIIIGAGPAGLSCAVQLVDHGVPARVFEASPQVGGLARSLHLWGQTVDLGPHRFFTANRIVIDHWKRFVGTDYTTVRRLTRVLHAGKLFEYPLRPLNALRNLQPWDAARSLASYGRRRLRPLSDPKTFEDWVKNRFGDHLFHLFFETYTEKVWGIPCSKLDADWAAQRIKKLSLGEVVRAALVGNRGRHPTLVDQFAYPNGGSGSVYERMADHVRAHGGEVRLGARVRRVLQDEAGAVQGVELEDGSRHDARAVVSTMPLTLVAGGLRDVPATVRDACEKLRYRNTVLVYLEVDHPAVFPDNWIYVHDPRVQHGRITNFRNWSPALQGGRPTSILCMEYWCFDRDGLWTQGDAALSDLAQRELGLLRLLPAGARILNTHVLRLQRSYPVYERGYGEHLSRIRSWVEQIPGLTVIGRGGAFKYNNQDHSILMGLLAATELLTGRRQGLWDVNSDAEYQESAEVREVFGPPRASDDA